MKFAGVITLFAASLSLVSGAAVEPAPQAVHTTPTQVIASIQMLTTASMTTSNKIAQVDLLNGLFICGQIPGELSNIARAVTTAISSLQGPPFDDKAAKDVVAVLTNFVTVHQQLLYNLVGKRDTFYAFLLAGPIRTAILGIEASVDSFVLGLIRLIPTQKNAVMMSKVNLDSSLVNAANAYSSPL